MTTFLTAESEMGGAAWPGQPTILTVDDCAEDLELCVYALRNAGYRVMGANRVEQAQRLAQEQGTIDLLVTDFNMPGMNGVELGRWFHAQFPGSKVLLMSGCSWGIEVSLEEMEWLIFIDKTRAFGNLAGLVKELLARTGARTEGFGRGEIDRRASAETVVMRSILERREHERAWE